MRKSIQVFISHSAQDQLWVREFAEKLSNEGINVWLAEREITSGESVSEQLEEGLRSSEFLVFVLGTDSIVSPNVLFELGAALGMGKKVVAIVAKDVEAKDLPGPIRARHYLSMETPQETAREVAEALTSER